MSQSRHYYREKSPSDVMLEMRADYDLARNERWRRDVRGYAASGSGADYHYRSEADYLKIMELARYFDRNSMVVSRAVNCFIDNVLMGGMELDAKTGDEDLNRYIETKFSNWANDRTACDAAKAHNLNEIVECAVRGRVVDGDHFLILLGDGRIQSVEAHRCRTPQRSRRTDVVNGVHLSPTRERLAFWFTRDEIEPNRAIMMRDVSPQKAVDKSGRPLVLQHYHARRISQTRGVSALCPANIPVSMHDDLQLAKLVQAQRVSNFAIIYERDIGAEDLVPSAKNDPTIKEERGIDGETRLVRESGVGSEYEAPPGVRVKGLSPNVPNTEFFPHVELILMFISVNLGVPLITLLLNAKETNFSGWRGATNEARIGYRRQRRMAVEQVLSPVYAWKMRRWLDPQSPEFDKTLFAMAKNVAEELLYRHVWTCEGWPYIQPMDDAEAEGVRLKNLTASLTQISDERGRDFPELAEEIVGNRKLIILLAAKAARDVNESFPEAKADWREILDQGSAAKRVVKEPIADEPEKPKPVEKAEPRRAAPKEEAAAREEIAA